ncbi:hypothetical protein EHH54_34725 [Rhizobium leguminosarum]|uniref:hypothetical protein n=1 Tax=Rhizobium leguminosarum TaxID=384 RepID=UPI000FEC3EA4|nr:hypothetical protein [Rhizobium leguminosarum]RWX26622.1 hypothetical protein EHH54_34725 [Rhizobium leguminosarum]
MTVVTSAMLADMHARRMSGETIATIAARYNIKPMTCYQRLRREYGLENYNRTPLIAANDNNADRTTRMVPHNGGCSTTSGLMPVSVRRTADDDLDNDADYQAGLAVSAYALQVATEMQVAA